MCVPKAVLHTHLGSVLPRGVPCLWSPAEVSAAVWGAAWQLPWSLQPCAPLQPPPAAVAHSFLANLQTSTYMSLAAVLPTGARCGIVSGCEQQWQPASMGHCRPSPQCAPLQELCHRTAMRQRLVQNTPPGEPCEPYT